MLELPRALLPEPLHGQSMQPPCTNWFHFRLKTPRPLVQEKANRPGIGLVSSSYRPFIELVKRSCIIELVSMLYKI